MTKPSGASAAAKAAAKVGFDSARMEQCGKCDRCEIRSVGDGDLKGETADLECRVCKQETKIAELGGKVERLEKVLAEFVKLFGSGEAESTDVKLLLGKVKNEFDELNVGLGMKAECQVVEAIEKRVHLCEDGQNKLVTDVKDLSDKAEWTEVVRKGRGRRLSNRQAAQNQHNQNMCKVSFAEECKSKDEMTVVVVGDSMVRGVGHELVVNSQMFSYESHGGAKIEDITKMFKEKSVRVREDTHLVVMVGTNNLSRDYTEMIMDKYKDLLKSLKENRTRKVTVVGIMRRGKDDAYIEGKRRSLNVRLQDLCNEAGVEFVDPHTIYKCIWERTARECSDVDMRVLDRGGLHLNHWGQHEVASVLFKHCVSFLG